MKRWMFEFLPVGRLQRGQFWLRHLLGLPPALFLCSAADALLGELPGLLAAIGTTLFLISVWGRRLHDRGRTAWYLVLAAVPVLGPLWLAAECALRGTDRSATRDVSARGAKTDYLSVQDQQGRRST